MNQITSPVIAISGSIRANVGAINTLEELSNVAVKFAKIVKADRACSVIRLASFAGNVGDAFLQGERAELTDALAGSLLATFAVADQGGIDLQELTAALRNRLEQQITAFANVAVTELFSDRGMTDIAA